MRRIETPSFRIGKKIGASILAHLNWRRNDKP
jgi:hypothetical protein